MALEGNLHESQLPDILQLVAVQQKTGILTVQGEQDIIAVSFLRGSVVAADALNQTVEDGLGQILVQERLVRQDVFASIAAEHQAGGERLVDLLLMRGALSRPQLLHALRLQTMRMLLQLLRWKEGEFKFYAGEEVSYEDGFEPIAVEQVLLRAVEELGPSALPDQIGLPDRDSVFETVLPVPAFRVYGRDSEGPDGHRDSTWISESEERILSWLDSRTPAHELALRHDLDEARVILSLFRLRRAGLARERARAGGRPASLPAPGASSAAPLPRVMPSGPSAAPGNAPPSAPFVPPASAGAVPKSPPPIAPTASLAPIPSMPPSRRSPRSEEHLSAVPEAGLAPRLPVAPRLKLAARIIALGLCAVLAAVALLRPRHLALPYPWLEPERTQIEKAQRTSLVLALDRVARAHFLLEGRYPATLTDFLGLGLLGRVPRDPSGLRYEYRPGSVGYSLTPVGSQGPVAELAVSEGIPGDFLLDPEFLAFDESSKVPPLVLLD